MTPRPASPTTHPETVGGPTGGPSPDAWSPTVRPAAPLKMMQTLRGIAVSPGVAIGPPQVIDPRGLRLPHRAIAAEAVDDELRRLDRGLELARVEAEAAELEARQRIGPQYADILAAHARMITDPTLRRDARSRIEDDKIAAEHAVSEVLEGHASRLARLADSHLAARAADVRDIQQRILGQLLGRGPLGRRRGPGRPDRDPGPRPLAERDGRARPRCASSASPPRPAAAPATPPSSPRRWRSRPSSAWAASSTSPRGAGWRSSTATRAWSSSTPTSRRSSAIAGPPPSAPPGSRGSRAWPTSPPRPSTASASASGATSSSPARSPPACERGADGVGLYRTEFLYLNADRAPTEEEQFAAYAAVVRSLKGRPVTIRTLDLGADKMAAYHPGTGPAGRDSVLGLRSLRLSLRDPALFRTQLRAILRASTLGDVRVLFPLVSTLGEFRQARAVLDDVASELNAEGVAVRADLPVGVMVEVPAAAVMADQFAKEVDFFSIGTNDLIQYTLAVDRTDETVAELYSAADPAVLRLIGMVVAAAAPRNIEVTVCGTMGGEPLYTMLLLGLGLRHLSMPPHQLPEIKRVIRGIGAEDARAVAAEALRQETSQAVVRLLDEALRRALPDTPAPITRGRDG